MLHVDRIPSPHSPVFDADQMVTPVSSMPAAVEQRTPSPPAYSPISSPLSNTTQLLPTSLSTIQDGIDLTDTPWLDITKDPTTSLRYCILTNIHPVHSSRSRTYAVNPVSLKFTIIVHVDCTWQCFVGSSTIDVGKVPCLSEVPVILHSAADLQLLLTTLQIHKVCPGNHDEKYVTMLASRKGTMKSRKAKDGSQYLALLIPVYLSPVPILIMKH